MKILFIGATGMLGKPVAKELLQAGFELTFLARDPAKMQPLFPGSKVIGADVLNLDSLIMAMRGQDAVYCNLSIQQNSKQKDPQPEREGVDNILAAAKASGIKRIAYLSSLVHQYNGMNGFNWWAFDIKASAVEKLKASGIPSTIFYPSTFMECFPFQMLKGNKIAALGRSVAPMWFVAAEDYGKQVAASFRLLTDESREYAVQGQEAYTFGEANKIFAGHYTPKKLGVIRAPMGLMKFLGLFAQQYNYAWHICEALNKYPEQFESESTWKELGRPSISLAAYAAGLK